MHILVKLAAGAAAIGGLSAPALAQYQYPQQTYPQYQYPQAQYPQQTYPQQYQYPQSQYPQTGYGYPSQPGYGAYGQQGVAQNPVQSIIDQLLGNRYQTSDRSKVAQCAAAAQNQAATQFRAQPYGNAYGYRNNSSAYGSARVTGITSVQRVSNGLRVRGTMSSGNASRAYGYQGYTQGYATAQNDLSFRCTVDYRGAVTGIRVTQNRAAYRR